MRKTKRLLTLFILICIMASIAVIPTYADNEDFDFTLTNTLTAYNTYPHASNPKMYAADNATVRVFDSGSDKYAPGWGFAFAMKYLNPNNNSYFLATKVSPAYWIRSNTADPIVHPAYENGENIVNRYYYVAARIDDDYTGTYECSGRFNSDYTTGW